MGKFKLMVEKLQKVGSCKGIDPENATLMGLATPVMEELINIKKQVRLLQSKEKHILEIVQKHGVDINILAVYHGQQKGINKKS